MARLTPRGALLLVLGVGLATFGFVARQRDVVWPALFLALVPFIASALVAASLKDQAATRRVRPDRLPARHLVQVDLDVRQSGVGLGVLHLIEETVPAALGSGPAFVQPASWGPSSGSFQYTLTPALRGRYELGPVRWRTVDALGLASGSRERPERSHLVVTPTVIPLGQAQHGSGVGLSGEAAALRSGLVGPDDALIRDYRPRDDVRRIHWPSTARTGTLMVRREERAWDPSALVLLDSRRAAHRDEGPDGSFEWAVSAAASVGVHLIEAGFTVELVDASGAASVSGGSATAPGHALLDHLTDVALCDQQALSAAVDAGTRRTRAQLLVVVLGALSMTDALALSLGRRDRRLCWLMLGPSVPPDDGATAEALTLLRHDGWQVVTGAQGLGVAAAWRALDAGVRR